MESGPDRPPVLPSCLGPANTARCPPPPPCCLVLFDRVCARFVFSVGPPICPGRRRTGPNDQRPQSLCRAGATPPKLALPSSAVRRQKKQQPQPCTKCEHVILMIKRPPFCSAVLAAGVFGRASTEPPLEAKHRFKKFETSDGYIVPFTQILRRGRGAMPEQRQLGHPRRSAGAPQSSPPRAYKPGLGRAPAPPPVFRPLLKTRLRPKALSPVRRWRGSPKTRRPDDLYCGCHQPTKPPLHPAPSGPACAIRDPYCAGRAVFVPPGQVRALPHSGTNLTTAAETMAPDFFAGPPPTCFLGLLPFGPCLPSSKYFFVFLFSEDRPTRHNIASRWDDIPARSWALDRPLQENRALSRMANALFLLRTPDPRPRSRLVSSFPSVCVPALAGPTFRTPPSLRRIRPP